MKIFSLSLSVLLDLFLFKRGLAEDLDRATIFFHHTAKGRGGSLSYSRSSSKSYQVSVGLDLVR